MQIRLDREWEQNRGDGEHSIEWPMRTAPPSKGVLDDYEHIIRMIDPLVRIGTHECSPKKYVHGHNEDTSIDADALRTCYRYR